MKRKLGSANPSRRVCCVPGCRHSEYKNKDLHFYSFPGRPWEEERKNKWIAASRVTEIKGKSWYPALHTRICSSHFVGGEKSNDPRKEAYNPTIFPWSARRATADPETAFPSAAKCSTSVSPPHGNTHKNSPFSYLV